MEFNHCQSSPPAPHKPYLTCSSTSTPCPQVLGYTMGKTLGSGKFAKVKAAWSPFERQMIAIKIVNKTKLYQDQDDLDMFLHREIFILQKVTHPNIISLLQIIESENRCYFAMELAENGDLLDYLNSRGGSIREEEARYVFYQTCQAVAYCHSRTIAHRDLKLENVFLTKEMEVKLGDFGFALKSQNNLCSTPCGSYCYGAPEVVLAIHPEYNPLLADSWSMGVILYAMVMGHMPFGSDDLVRHGRSNYHLLPLEGNHTEEFNNLVMSLLTVDVTTRPLIADIASHVWMTALPSTRPSWEGPCGSKYTIQNSLPHYFHNLDPEDYGTSKVNTPYPREKTQATKEATNPVPPDANQPAEAKADETTPAESAASNLVDVADEPVLHANSSGSNRSLNARHSSINVASQLSICATDPSISASKPSISTGNSSGRPINAIVSTDATHPAEAKADKTAASNLVEVADTPAVHVISSDSNRPLHTRHSSIHVASQLSICATNPSISASKPSISTGNSSGRPINAIVSTDATHPAEAKADKTAASNLVEVADTPIVHVNSSDSNRPLHTRHSSINASHSSICATKLSTSFTKKSISATKPLISTAKPSISSGNASVSVGILTNAIGPSKNVSNTPSDSELKFSACADNPSIISTKPLINASDLSHAGNSSVSRCKSSPSARILSIDMNLSVSSASCPSICAMPSAILSDQSIGASNLPVASVSPACTGNQPTVATNSSVVAPTASVPKRSRGMRGRRVVATIRAAGRRLLNIFRRRLRPSTRSL